MNAEVTGRSMNADRELMIRVMFLTASTSTTAVAATVATTVAAAVAATVTAAIAATVATAIAAAVTAAIAHVPSSDATAAEISPSRRLACPTYTFIVSRVAQAVIGGRGSRNRSCCCI